MPFGAAIAAVGAIGGAAISSRASGRAAKAAREGAQLRPASLDIGFGQTNISADRAITQEPNQFTDLSRQFIGEAGQQLQQAGTTQFDLGETGFTAGNIGQLQQGVRSQFGALQESIGTQPQFDGTAFAQTQFDRLQSLASRGEEIAANRVAGGLFSRGRLGRDDTTTGAAFEGLARAQESARTERALQATQLATSEGDRLFRQGQVGIQNQFGLLGAAEGQLQTGTQGFLGLQGFQNATTQQNLQNAIGFGGAAGQVIQPNFQAITAAQNLATTDQASRAGVASTTAGIIAQSGANTASTLGNVFGGIGEAIINRE